MTASNQAKPTEPVYTPHPYAKIFPAMEADGFAVLVADIKANGLRDPITVNGNNQILDGVNRYQACHDAGIKPQFEHKDFSDAEVLAFVISRNLHRRHLDTSQRAAIAAEIANLKQGGTQPANLPVAVSQAKAAKLMNVSERTTRSAVKVKEASPALHAAVKAGKVSVHAAEAVCELPTAERVQAIEQVSDSVGRVGGKRTMSSAPTASPVAAGKQSKTTLHPAYAPLFEELDRLPRLLDEHPLSVGPLEQLSAGLATAVAVVAKARRTQLASRKEPESPPHGVAVALV